MYVPSSSLQGSEGKSMSKPYSIDPIAPDLLSLMTDSSGAVLPHAASVRDDTPAMGEEECLDSLHQQPPVPEVMPDLVQVLVHDDEATIRQRQKERRQQRQQSRPGLMSPQVYRVLCGLRRKCICASSNSLSVGTSAFRRFGVGLQMKKFHRRCG